MTGAADREGEVRQHLYREKVERMPAAAGDMSRSLVVGCAKEELLLVLAYSSVLKYTPETT